MKPRINPFLRLLAVAFSLATVNSASAASAWFDVDGTTAGFGVVNGSTYDLTGAFWTTTYDGTAATVAYSTANTQFMTGAGVGTSYTVRLGATGATNTTISNFGININGTADGVDGDGSVNIGTPGDTGVLAFNTITFGAGGTGTLTINNPVNENSKNVNFAGGNVTINGVLSGSGGSITNSNLFGIGSGMLTLAGNNTYTGAINFGTSYDLKLANQNAMAAGTVNLTGGGLVFDSSVVGNAFSIGALAGTTNIALQNNAGSPAVIDLTLGGANAVTSYSGNLSAGNTILKTGTGWQTLSGTNSYPGTTTISGGVLQFGKTVSLYNNTPASWTEANIIVNSGATLGLNVSDASGDFTTGNVTTILTNLGGLGGSLASGGLKAGSGIGFDTTNATGTVTITDNILNSTGAVGGAIGVMKLGSGTLDLTGVSTAAASNYTGTTAIDKGTLILPPGADLTGGLTFGAVSSSPNAGTLDLSIGSATFAGGLTVQTNSATANTISIGTGQTLTTGGTVVIGANAGITPGLNPASKLTVSGLGSWAHTASGGVFRVGNNVTGTTAQRAANAVLDLSGLTQFTADLRSSSAGGGTFVVGDNSAGATGTGTMATLSGNNTIYANAIQVTAANGAPGTIRLALGSGDNVFNANTLSVGNSQRSDDTLNFAGSTGTFRLRALTGTAGLNVGNLDKNSSGNRTAILDLSGHSSDMVINTLAIGNTGGSLSGGKDHVATFTFDSGTMTVTNARVGRRSTSTSTNLGSITANLNIGNGITNLANTSTLSTTFIIGWNEDAEGTSVGNVNIAGSNTTVNFTSAANNVVIGQSSTAGNATGTLAISGGATTITRGITLGNRTGAGTVNGTLSLTGGSLTLGTQGITTTAGTTSTLTLDGGALNMNSQAIGDATNLITSLNLQTGTLSNVLQINNGAGLSKNTAGTLTLAGTNTYTGATNVSVGTLALGGGSSHTSPITVDSGATLGFTSGSTTTTSSTVTFSGATANVSVSGTPVAGTLLTTTVPGGITGTPVLDPAIPGYVLAIEDGGTTLKLNAVATNNYDTWASTNSVPGQAANLDHDNDGVSNGVEYFIGGPTGNTTGFTPVPGVTTTLGVSSVTWVKAATYTGTYGTDFIVETSTTLAAGSWSTEPSPGTVTISGNNVTFTFPAGPVKKFARLKVTGP